MDWVGRTRVPPRATQAFGETGPGDVNQPLRRKIGVLPAGVADAGEEWVKLRSTVGLGWLAEDGVGRGVGGAFTTGRSNKPRLPEVGDCITSWFMSLVQLQTELSKLSPQEQLVLADFLVLHAEKNSEPSETQYAELDRRYAEALAKPESLLAPENVVQRLQR